MIAVDVKDVSVRFITGDLKDIGLKTYILKKMRGQLHVEQFWANQNISFSLNQGDMLGIIGKNGAGKSTLLKSISGVLEPTKGKIKVRGNVAALLELTAGFDGELTVRENTYLRGALLGYTKQYMDEMYEQIIEFAELKDFQDRQFNQLSSGMKSRLAFSIACLVNPDILILDEVLSVGDGAFREKSGKKMREILDRGVTGLLVSHSVEQVRELCNKVLWLDKGEKIIYSDDVITVCNCYEEFLKTNQLPRDEEDIIRMSDAWKKRVEEKQRMKKRRYKSAMIKELESKSSDVALQVAVEIIQKQKPELLNQSGEGSVWEE